MERKQVTIVGGGISGLSTALALRRSGNFDVQILEASSESSFQNSSAGAAVQITPNGLRALQLLGGNDVLQQVLQHSSVIENNMMILPSRETAYDSLQALPPTPPSVLPTVMIRWGILRQFLAEQLPQNSILLNQQIASYNQTDGTVVLKDGSTKEKSSLLVGANGKASSFRPTPLVASNHRVNLKAVLHQVAPLPNASSTTYSLFSPTGLACFLGPAGEGWTYWAISIPVQNQQEYFQIEEDAQALKMKLLQVVMEESSSKDERQVFVDLIRETDASQIFLQASTQAELPETFYENNLVLVGDAAHAMNVSYGQSVSFALEDAATLAHCLHDSSQQDQDIALAQYSELRRSRCLELQQKSKERTAKAMRGESTEDVTRWIHDWDLVIPKTTNDVPMAVVG